MARTFLKVLALIVGGSHLVSWCVGELAFDHVGPEAHFVQDGGRRCPEEPWAKKPMLSFPFSPIRPSARFRVVAVMHDLGFR